MWNMTWDARGSGKVLSFCSVLFLNNSKDIIELNLTKVSRAYTHYHASGLYHDGAAPRGNENKLSIFVYKTTKEIFSELFLFCEKE